MDIKNGAGILPVPTIMHATGSIHSQSRGGHESMNLHGGLLFKRTRRRIDLMSPHPQSSLSTYLVKIFEDTDSLKRIVLFCSFLFLFGTCFPRDLRETRYKIYTTTHH